MDFLEIPYPAHICDLTWDLISKGAVQAKKYVSARFPLEKTAAAFAYHESRAGLKVIVAPHGEKAAWT